ncbi:hypothetical protein B9G98_03507 [Wickerhamiella sorbophila]|uniref:DUF3020 domain-containing protein n=1 Tax=Wickerhamiella sorbophila TaxID=45607 RepID=A0A2T0FLN9_9ASCO|nr:hypothetical protein B9G98_03507 [Wickerhamiella sorbophila]PRT55887.1 hypothetical protein B9G98_03507 [Wickerhamiella sorbophila]
MSVDEATLNALKRAVESIKDNQAAGTEDAANFAAALSAVAAGQTAPPAASQETGEIDSAVFNQLAAAIGKQNGQANANANPNYPQQEALGLEVDRQLLLDSIKSIVSGDGDSNEQHAQTTTLTQDEQAMQEALLMATRQLEGTGQPAAYQYSAYQQGSFPLEGEADAATLQVVQSVLQDLGGAWGDMDGGRAKRRARHASPMTEEDRLRIREDNRNRKKRWRDSNADRNRDNDLRGRITRRAHVIFGPVDSKQKLDWIEEEYLKRRERRMLREGTGKFREHAISSLGGQHRSHASNQLSALFRESNAILTANRPVTAGYVPPHLIAGPMVPCPSRPSYQHRYERKTRRSRGESRDTMGAPPVLEDLLIKLE